MARFILDVNSNNNYKMSSQQVDKICKSMSEALFDGEIFRIVCIDDTTDNQFHEEENKNKISKGQINSYNKFLNKLERKE
jgi:hypothetical protein